MRRITLINPNTNAKTTQLMVDIAQAALQDGFLVSGRTVTAGAPLIVDEASLAAAAVAVAALMETIEPGADGYIISAFGDPGIAAARTRSPVPVTGIAEAGMAEAAHGGRRFGVATTTPDLRDAVQRSAEGYGHGDRFTGVRITDGDPANLHADGGRLIEALAIAVQRCIDDGAEAVVIGGGPLAQAARTLAPRFAIPLIEPVPAAARALAGLLG